MAGGAKPITGRLPRPLTSGANPNYGYPSGDAVADFYETGGGAPRVGGGFEDVTIDDGFMEILKEMSPDLMEKYRQEDIAPRSAGRVGSQVRHPYGGAWDRPPLSMAPWLKKKRRV